MERCLVVLLLGFDEVRAVIDQYSSEDVKRDIILCPSTSDLPQDADLTYSDAVTICRDELATPSDIRKTKYSCCIIISLVEPFPRFEGRDCDFDFIHRSAFTYAREYLKTVPNWSIGLKFIVRHHGASGGVEYVGFDAKLMMERLVPNTFHTGFVAGKTFDLRKKDLKPLGLNESKELSTEITERTTKQVHISTLVSWILSILPDMHSVHYKLFGADNPLRITMGGCYAGRIGFSKSVAAISTSLDPFTPALIKRAADRFKTTLESKSIFGLHIEIIGAVTWTFYNKFRDVSAVNFYSDIESNDDPFRASASPTEKYFFVKASDYNRRKMTRIAKVSPSKEHPNQYDVLYGHRPKKGETIDQLPELSLQQQRDENFFELERWKLSDQIMCKFLLVAEKYDYKRMPVDMGPFIRYLGGMVYSAQNRVQFEHMKRLCREAIIKMKESVPTLSAWQMLLSELLQVFS